MSSPIYLLDSNICIYVLRDARSNAAMRLGQCVPGTVATSTVVLAEILHGTPPHDRGVLRAVDALFEILQLLPFDEAAARIYATIPFKHGTFDRLIAAQALAYDLVVVTNNESDFADVPGLLVENWTKA